MKLDKRCTTTKYSLLCWR